MDIRYRFRRRLEHARSERKIKYYQSGYDEKRLEQMVWLLRSFARQKDRCGTHKELFADYRKKKAFDSVSVRNELLKYDVISFDVFDTLLRRNVSQPADVFRLLEKKTGVLGFAESRTEAEKTARKLRYARRRSAEVNIEEIYRTMLWEWNTARRNHKKWKQKQQGQDQWKQKNWDQKQWKQKQQGQDQWKQKQRGQKQWKQKQRDQDQRNWNAGRKTELETWIREEIKMERHCCSADPVMLRIVNMLLANGKRVIAVSDMYLHQAQIRELLHHCGYTALEEIYVSCDYRAGKSDGKLFPIILRKIGTEQRLAHVGDNFYSDVYMQKNLDMSAIHYIKDGG